jgi:demethylmenaquinone methyltransferase/2-methoxy-6-polyprenyl-1,4-benzoquinol methylase
VRSDGVEGGARTRSPREIFDPIGDSYERVGALLSLGQDPLWRRRLVDVVAPRDGERVLDVATGTGLVARELRGRARCSVVGIDISPGMLAAAKADGVAFVRGRAEGLPFADGRFDALTFTYLLRYVEDPPRTIAELARVVRPGGRIASLEFHVPRSRLLRALWLVYTRVGLRAAGALISRPWRRVGAFLGGSISDFYARQPLSEVEAMWRAAGLVDVRSQLLSLGGAVVTWGTKGTAPAAQPIEAEPRARPAFYALAPGGWRDYVTLLHPPYTLWHLSYVALGAAFAPTVHLERLVGTLVAFLLALGVGVHALDELHGRPLRTRIPRLQLVGFAFLGLGAAVALGLLASSLYSPSLLVWVALGVALALLYPLELAGGRLHSDLWFAMGWGAFPLLSSYWVNALELSWPALLGAAYAIATSYAQRRLSTWVRLVRRRATAAWGELVLDDGGWRPLDAATLIAAPESALRWLTVATAAIALAALAFRLTG